MSPVSRTEYARQLWSATEGREERAAADSGRVLPHPWISSSTYHPYALSSTKAAKQQRKPGWPSRHAKLEMLAVLHGVRQTAHYPCWKRLKTILTCRIAPYEQIFGVLHAWVKQALGGHLAEHHRRLLAHERLLASAHIPQRAKDTLTDLYHTLNPFDLRRAIDAKIVRIRTLAR